MERDDIKRREEDREREDKNLDWRKERKNHVLSDSPEYARAWLNVCSIEKEMDGSLCAFVCICMRVYVCIYVCMYACVYVHMYVLLYVVCIYMCVCTYVHMYVHVCVCVWEEGDRD